MHIEFFRVTFVYVITLSFIFCVYISYIDSRHVVSHHFCTSLPFLIYMLLTQDMNFTTILYIHVYNNVTNISAPRVLHFSAIHIISVATVAINIMGDVLEGESTKVCAVVIDPEGDCPVNFSFEVNITYQYSNGMDQPGGICTTMLSHSLIFSFCVQFMMMYFRTPLLQTVHRARGS